eukprot:1151483-Pelagomonas_calceolata.AAC.3
MSTLELPAFGLPHIDSILEFRCDIPTLCCAPRVQSAEESPLLAGPLKFAELLQLRITLPDLVCHILGRAPPAALHIAALRESKGAGGTPPAKATTGPGSKDSVDNAGRRMQALYGAKGLPPLRSKQCDPSTEVCCLEEEVPLLMARLHLAVLEMAYSSERLKLVAAMRALEAVKRGSAVIVMGAGDCCDVVHQKLPGAWEVWAERCVWRMGFWFRGQEWLMRPNCKLHCHFSACTGAQWPLPSYTSQDFAIDDLLLGSIDPSMLALARSGGESADVWMVLQESKHPIPCHIQHLFGLACTASQLLSEKVVCGETSVCKCCVIHHTPHAGFHPEIMWV